MKQLDSLQGQFSNIVNAVACRKCPVHQYNAAEVSPPPQCACKSMPLYTE